VLKLLLTACFLLSVALQAQIPTNTTRVAQGSLNGQVVSKVAPVYPIDAKVAHVEGIVKLDVLIGTDGHVQGMKLLEGPTPLVQAAMDAVSKWVYKPVLLNGQPTTIVTQIDINFTLQQ